MRYLVVGGVAVVLHGIVRLTVDLDLMVDLESKNLRRFIEAMKSLGYKPRAPVAASDLLDQEKRRQWADEKNMLVFSFYNPKKPYEVVDIFIDEPIDFDEAYSGRKTYKAGSLNIPVISIENLKKLKKSSGREQDKLDIEALKALEDL